MRLLHTSDWHLGRSLHGADLRAAQAGFVDAIVETVRAERVDLVVVAGDVYDRAIPPLDAVALFEDALVRLRAAGARVVVSSGNHDSAVRLGFGSRLVDASGVHLRTDVAGLATPLVLADAHGDVGIYAIPYLEPDAVRGVLGATGAGHVGVLTRAMELIRADAQARGLRRSVVAAHAWVTAGPGSSQVSDSERDISVGGVSHAPAGLFAGVGYTALGHLHGSQRVTDTIRYSGSPMAFSFSEARHRKGWWLVDLDESGGVQVVQVDAPVHRRLATLRGAMEQLVGSREFAGHEDAFVAVTITDAIRPADAMDRLRRRFPHALTIAWAPTGTVVDGRSYHQRVEGRDDLTVVTGFVEHVRHAAADGDECALLQQAVEAARVEDAERRPVEVRP